MRVIASGIVFDARRAPSKERCCTFPSAERLADGRIVAVFRTGSTKDSPDEDVRIMLSSDDGASWEPHFGGFGDVGAPGGRIRAAAVTELRPGRLLGSFLWVDHTDPTLPLANPATQGILPTAVMVGQSHDAGRTWSRLLPVPLEPHRGNATTGAVLELKGGDLALPYEAWKDYNDTDHGRHHAALRLSSDGGHSWGAAATVAHDPAARMFYWDQRLAIHPDDGRLVALLWTHDRALEQDAAMHIAWGSADGRRWSEPRSTGIQGQIAAPLALPGNRLLMVYVHRHRPPGLRAVLSDDLGASWRADELVIYEKTRGGGEAGIGERREFGDYWSDMNIWTFGHPGALVLPGGDVLVTYYAGDLDALSIHWARIAL